MIEARIVAILMIVTALVAGTASWYVVDLRANAKIAAIEKKVAEDDRREAVDSLNLMTGQMEAVHDAAAKAVTQLGVTNAALAKIGKGLNNAKPLPPDCKPDAVRVESMNNSIDVINQAIRKPN